MFQALITASKAIKIVSRQLCTRRLDLGQIWKVVKRNQIKYQSHEWRGIWTEFATLMHCTIYKEARHIKNRVGDQT